MMGSSYGVARQLRTSVVGTLICSIRNIHLLLSKPSLYRVGPTSAPLYVTYNLWPRSVLATLWGILRREARLISAMNRTDASDYGSYPIRIHDTLSSATRQVALHSIESKLLMIEVKVKITPASRLSTVEPEPRLPSGMDELISRCSQMFATELAQYITEELSLLKCTGVMVRRLLIHSITDSVTIIVM